MSELITFVNHASVIFSFKNIRLITDPWIFGTAFNDGWDLVSKLNFKKIIEMKPEESISLSEEFQIKCVPNGTYDSWFYAKIDDTKILNINDCMVDSVSQVKIIKKQISDVDILLTQFGYASWVGDPEDSDLRKNASIEKLNRIKIQSDFFKPKFIIPFASFVKFSHKDNHYMNDHINKIKNVEKFILEKTNSIPIILYPGDEWSGEKKINNLPAIEQYELDTQKTFGLHSNLKTISFEELKNLSSSYIKNIKLRNNWNFIKLLHKINFFKTTHIFLKDLNSSYSFNLINGLENSQKNKSDVDIITDSDSLGFVFSWDYGMDTLFVNARFRTSGGKIMNFFRLFLIGTLNNNGRTFPLGIIGFLFHERSMWKTKFLEIILGKYALK